MLSLSKHERWTSAFFGVSRLCGVVIAGLVPAIQKRAQQNWVTRTSRVMTIWCHAVEKRHPDFTTPLDPGFHRHDEA
jgi:hypothetical protein